MSYTPVELRHVRIGRGLFGYKRGAVEQLLLEVADSFEDVWRERAELADQVEEMTKSVDELRRREELLTNTLVAAEQAATDVRGHAKREAELILAEAHQAARSISRGAQSEHSRLSAEVRRMEALLRAALGMVEQAAPEPATQSEPAPAQKGESWPRHDDTREFPRVLPVPGFTDEPEAQAG